MADPTHIRFTASDEDAGRRLDQVLAARVPGLSRRRARVLLDIGGVFIDRRRVKVAGRLVRAGEKIEAHLGGALERATKRLGTEARAADERRLPPVPVVFEDDDIVVVDKPAGILTAPTPESDRNNLVSLLARRAPAGGGDVQARPQPQPLQIVHRIDLETSGLVVLAKSARANLELSERFRTHDLVREYLALVAGAFPDDVRIIDQPVGGRRAVTHVAVERRFGAAATMIRCRLETGRTHQIRLHVTALGHPVLGDPRYGGAGGGGGVAGRALPRPPRMALHATLLAFAHPASGAPLSFESPWPPDLAAWLDGLALRA